METANYDQDAVYRVINKGDKPLDLMYNNLPYHIESGADTFVPFGAIDTWFGNPNAVDGVESHQRYRKAEFDRLREKYGAYSSDELWAANKPKVEVWTSAGEQITTIIDDPVGLKISPVAQSQAEVDTMRTQLAQQQRSIAALEASLAAREHEITSEEDNQLAEDFDEVSEDTPDRPRVR